MWAVAERDGTLKPDRWETEEQASALGLAGKYRHLDAVAIEVDPTPADAQKAARTISAEAQSAVAEALEHAMSDVPPDRWFIDQCSRDVIDWLQNNGYTIERRRPPSKGGDLDAGRPFGS